MRELGYVEGKNLTWEARFADNHYERLPEWRSKQQNRFEFVVNLKTAKAQSLSLSKDLIARADRVIE